LYINGTRFNKPVIIPSRTNPIPKDRAVLLGNKILFHVIPNTKQSKAEQQKPKKTKKKTKEKKHKPNKPRNKTNESK
jgi:hypothetical protein